MLTIVLPGGADDLDEVFKVDSELTKPAARRQSMAILAPVIEEEEDFRPGEIAVQRELQKKRELYQEASDVINHFNRCVLDALIRCTRSTLECIKRRVSSPSTLLYGDADEKRKMDHRPAFKVKLTLAVPHISLKPGLDEIQSALNNVVQQVVAVNKSVYQWRQGPRHTSQVQTGLAAVSGILAAQSGVLAARSGVLASVSGNLGSGPVAAVPLKNFFKSVSENKEVAKLVSMLSSTVSSAKALVTQSLDHFKKYEELWTIEKEEHVKQFMESNPDLSDIEGKIKAYVKTEEAVVEETEQLEVGSLALLTGEHS